MLNVLGTWDLVTITKKHVGCLKYFILSAGKSQLDHNFCIVAQPQLPSEPLVL